jgi:hypothetical protein
MPYCSPHQPPVFSRSVGLGSAASDLDFTSTLVVHVGLGASGHVWHTIKSLRYDHTGILTICGL